MAALPPALTLRPATDADAGFAQAQAGQLRLLDYRQLPGVVWEELLAELGPAPLYAQLEALRLSRIRP
ncbi:MAG: hypothetical protein WCC39_05090 [Telluria sp.]